MIRMSFAAFPDLNANLDLVVAEGDIVVGRMTTTGTHQGGLMGIPASGKKFTMTEIHISASPTGRPWSTGVTSTHWA